MGAAVQVPQVRAQAQAHVREQVQVVEPAAAPHSSLDHVMAEAVRVAPRHPLQNHALLLA